MTPPKHSLEPEEHDSESMEVHDDAPTVEQAYGHYMQACRDVLMPEHEQYADFLLLRDHMFCDAAPADAIEGMLVDRLVSLIWRLRRAGNIERQLFERMMSPPPGNGEHINANAGEGNSLPAQIISDAIATPTLNSLDWLQRYDAQLDRSVYQALRELRNQQHWRQQREAVIVTAQAQGQLAPPPDASEE